MKSKYPSLTPSQIKYKHEENGGVGFSRGNMKFHGDTMKNFGCYQDVVVSWYDPEGKYHENGIERHVYVIYRKYVKNNQRKIVAYFCAKTFNICFLKH